MTAVAPLSHSAEASRPAVAAVHPARARRRSPQRDWDRLRTVARMVIATLPEARWYDAGFHARFEAARHFLALVRPEALAEFVAGMARLQTRADFTARVERALIDRQTVAMLRAEAQGIVAQRPELHERERFGRIVVRDHAPFADLANTLAPLVSRLAGEPVEPSYNFLSVYGAEGRCAIHLDEPSAKWTLDLCLAQDEPWPLHVSRPQPWPRAADFRAFDPARAMADPAMGFAPLVMAPGDGLLFSGSGQWHYRAPRIAPNPHARASRPPSCTLLFLHYRPAASAALVDPRHWASHFQLPELAILVEEHDRLRPVSRG